MIRIDVACAVIQDEWSRVLICQKGDGRDRGKWEFPGGKRRQNEQLLKTAEREVFEELGLSVRGRQEVFSDEVQVGEFIYQLKFILCYCSRPGSMRLQEHVNAIWVEPSKFPLYSFTKGDQKFVNSFDEIL
ncbi:NUDIX domain-containing protein [Cryomorphaceae bacterium]|nr:NUDIX domain-containing protein [Cryomorphaceae bacterium]